MFQKLCYDGHPGYCLHHTSGLEAGESTLRYLHRPKEMMLIYFISGSGHAKIEGKHYSLRQGDMIILSPSEWYQCMVDDTSYHERIVLHVSESILQHFPCEATDLLAPFYQREKGNGNHLSAEILEEYGIHALLRSLLALAPAYDAVSNILAICKITELLAYLNQILQMHIPDTSSQARINPLIGDVLIYLNAHFDEEFTTDDIARIFSINKSYLSHLFHENVGTSLWNYVILLRLQRFNDLLQSDGSLEELCYQVGFRNYANFFRLYKKHMGMTPSQYKKAFIMHADRASPPSEDAPSFNLFH